MILRHLSKVLACSMSSCMCGHGILLLNLLLNLENKQIQINTNKHTVKRKGKLKNQPFLYATFKFLLILNDLYALFCELLSIIIIKAHCQQSLQIILLHFEHTSNISFHFLKEIWECFIHEMSLAVLSWLNIPNLFKIFTRLQVEKYWRRKHSPKSPCGSLHTCHSQTTTTEKEVVTIPSTSKETSKLCNQYLGINYIIIIGTKIFTRMITELNIQDDKKISIATAIFYQLITLKFNFINYE